MNGLSIVTLGVKDLIESEKFYSELFGWRKSSVSSNEIVFYDAGGVVVALYPWDKLAEDALTLSESTGFRGVTFAHNMASKKEVDAFVQKAVKIGATLVKSPQEVFWGGYSSYLKDSNGHLWEVAFNPYTKVSSDGTLELA